MRPQFLHWSPFLVPEVLDQLDDFLDAASVVEDLSLHVMEIQLELLLVRSVERYRHEATRHPSVAAGDVGNSPGDLSRQISKQCRDVSCANSLALT